MPLKVYQSLTLDHVLAASRQERPKAGGDGEDGKLVFSDTGEFCRSLQLDEGEFVCLSYLMNLLNLCCFIRNVSKVAQETQSQMCSIILEKNLKFSVATANILPSF